MKIAIPVLLLCLASFGLGWLCAPRGQAVEQKQPDKLGLIENSATAIIDAQPIGDGSFKLLDGTFISTQPHKHGGGHEMLIITPDAMSIRGTAYKHPKSGKFYRHVDWWLDLPNGQSTKQYYWYGAKVSENEFVKRAQKESEGHK